MYSIPGRYRGARLALLVTGLLVGSVASAAAQGLYYKEITKDGRIYVFNIAANAERFEKSGEMGVGITKPGAGPNGETVIGDNERALQLFFFKHGIAEPVPDPPPPAAAAPPWRISGLVFGDYYSFIDSHLPAWDGQNGLWFRRIYFTYDHTFTPQITTRVRFEVNSNGKLQGGALTPYIKDAYFRWTYHGRQQLTAGIHPSTTFEFEEIVWGLRHIEKTPLDLYRTDSSRDTGATLSGPLNESQTWKYAFQFGNDASQNSETDKFKTIRAAVRYETNPGFSVEFVAGQYYRALDADRTLAQIFAAYRAKKGRVGFQYTYQKRRPANNTTAADIDLDIYSVFGVYDLKVQKYSVFVRYDRFDDACGDCAGNPPAVDYLPLDSTAPFGLTIAGFEYYLIPSLRFSPNIEYVSYSNPTNPALTRPKNDNVFRMTFYWTW